MKTIDDFYSRWNGKDVDLGKMCDLMFILFVDLGNAVFLEYHLQE